MGCAFAARLTTGSFRDRQLHLKDNRMDIMREAYKLVRWRLIPVRYAGKVRRSMQRRRPMTWAMPGPALSTFEKQGWDKAPNVPADLLEAIREKYLPRGDQIVPTERGHPFTNLFTANDITPEDPICRLAFSRELLEPADAYFGGRAVMNSIQLMYSWPTEGALRESQFWHRDFNDSRSLHYIAYLDDVLDAAAGPFVYVDRTDSGRIGRRPFIRRIDDTKFARELGGGTIRSFYGQAGEAIIVDPAACYHYGSRCRRPRFALFVTFSSDRPYTPTTDLILDNSGRLIATAKALRPELSLDYLHALLDA
jgi:hypothetical protein